jgi:hypothetical protein
MYNEKLELPIRIGSIEDTESYYQALPGSALVVQVLDGSKNLIARGFGASWNETYQMTPVMEWGKRYSVEIVKGAMPPGQISIQSMYFMDLNDTLPTFKNLASKRELTAIIQIANEEDATLNGIVLDVFQGVVIQGQQGNFNASNLYLRNCSMIYRKRLKGIEWLKLNPALKYPAKVGEEISFNASLVAESYKGEIGS